MRSRIWASAGVGSPCAAPRAGIFTGAMRSRPNVTRRFFAGKGMDIQIVKIEGSVELAPLLGLSDAIVDIVETGSTLRENGLEVYEDVAPISARVIVNTASIKLRKQEIEGLIARIEAVL